MSYNPKTNWQLNEIVMPADMNRIEQGIADLDLHSINYLGEITDVTNILNNPEYGDYPYEGIISSDVATNIGLSAVEWNIKCFRSSEGSGCQIAFPVYDYSGESPKYRLAVKHHPNESAYQISWGKWNNFSDGGNAELFGGNSTDKFLKYNGVATDCDECTTIGVYQVDESTLNIPSGVLLSSLYTPILFVIDEACQLFFTDVEIYKRSGTLLDGSSYPDWKSWKNVANGGNADTLDGLHSNEIASNPNLLDNPDFKINQRGESEYTITASGVAKSVYCVDRWSMYVPNTTKGSVIVTPNILGGMTISNQTNSIGTLFQKIEKYTNLFEKQVTFSANIDGKILSTTATVINATGEIGRLSTDFGFLRFYIKENAYVEAEICTNAGKSITVNWTKLEIGSIATPFCPSNSATELAKCQRYFNSLFVGSGIPVQYIGSGIAVSDSMATILVNLPIEMRSSTPTVSLTGTLYLSDGSHTAANSISVQGVSGSYLNRNVLQLNLTSDATLNRTATYLLSRRDTETTLTVSAEL